MTLRQELVEQMREAATSWAEGTEGSDRTELAEAVSFFVTTWQLIDSYTDWPWEKKER